MRPQAIDDPELAVRNKLLLCLTIVRWEKHVSGERHDIGLRLDAAECGLEISAGMQADMNIALVLVETIVPGGVRFECVLMGPHEDVVVWRRLGSAGKWQRALDHVGKAHSPFIGLFGTHRPTEDEL